MTDAATNTNATKTETSFVVTGFGPFGGVEANPTTVIVRRLDSYLRSSQQRQQKQQKQGSPRKDSNENGEPRGPNVKDRNHDDDDDDNYHNASRNGTTANGLSVVADLVKEYVVLETSAQDVNTTMDRIRRDCVETATNGSNDDFGGGGACNSSNAVTIPRRRQQQQKIILLHLGVGRSEGFRLESCAYNEASFRIPDFRGYQPWEKTIVADSSQSVGQCYETSLDLEKLQNQMQRDFPAIVTVVSTDPGRFVCNYVYCKSLEVSLPYSKGNESSTTVDRDTEPNFLCESLFLHVPHFDVVDEEEQLAYVAGLMKNLAKEGT